MEHVGRHLEKASSTTGGATVNEIVEQESDEFMIAWALAEKIIERTSSGGYKIHTDAGAITGDDCDADGEDE
jgi:predicted DNA-binding protein